MKRMLLFVIIAMSSFAANSQGNQAKLLADKIVAVVDDKIILKSDVFNAVADNKRHGIDHSVNEDCEMLREMMMQKALTTQAQMDSLHIDEQEVDAAMEQRIRYFISLYGSKEALEQVAGKTIYQIKEDSRKFIREKKLADLEQRLITDRIVVTPAEVKSYYSSIPKNDLSFYETQVELSEIVLYAKPGREMEQYAKEELTSLRKKIETGELSFEMAARLYSSEEETKRNGGFMECNRNDNTLNPEFKETVFSLKEQQLSKVFKTKSGYHIVQLVSRNGDDAALHHILVKPVITSEAMEKCIARLDTIRFGLIANSFTFPNAVERYSEDPQSKFTAGAITNVAGDASVTIKELDKDVVAILDKLKVGDYSTPIPFTDEQGKQGAKVLYLKSKTQPHIENLKDDYTNIAQRLIDQKKKEAIDKWYQHFMSQRFVSVSGDYIACNQPGGRSIK